jgi:uncharacterized protein YkwD
MPRSLTVFTMLLALLAAPVAHADLEETRATLRDRMVRLINRDREAYGLAPVQLDLEASRIGDAYCERQLRNGTTGHFTLDGHAPYMRYSFAGGNDGVSENAAAWSADYVFTERALYEMLGRSQDAMMAEMAPRDGHKRTILDPYATHVGVGLAWEKGEFRLVQEFVRRYIDWTRTPAREARLGDLVSLAGKVRPGLRVEAITVHFEPLPVVMTAQHASAIDTYSLPDARKEYRPRLRSTIARRDDGSMIAAQRKYENGSRGDFFAADDGRFTFDVPFPEGPGVYTVVVWVSSYALPRSIPASNISIRVSPFQPASERGAAGGPQRR